MAAAQQITAPIRIAATGPVSAWPSRKSSNSAENRMVAMVIPDTGLFEDPTRPDMYAATAENRNPATTITRVMAKAIVAESTTTT